MILPCGTTSRARGGALSRRDVPRWVCEYSSQTKRVRAAIWEALGLPRNLGLLAGQITGVVRLPAHMDWSGNPVYDLDAPGRLVDLYRTVIIEAATPEDLHTFLENRTLRRLWSFIWLPAVVRETWEARFHDLAAIGALAAPT